MYQAKLDVSETIFALTTGSLPSAVAIIRLSGPRAFEISSKIFTPHNRVFERIRGMWLGQLHDVNGGRIDEGMALSFVGPHSHSGDDTVEFHLHGSLSIVRRLEEVLLQCQARPAERGEFSYRAFLSGKISATDLETLGEVYLARQPADLAQLFSKKDNALASAISLLRAHLIRLQAILDTAVDFVEEYSSVLTAATEPIEAAIHGCSAIIQRYSTFREGGMSPRIVLAGSPNAGKSSLFNALLCRYRAIVHHEPGTTRDAIEEDVTVAGRTWKLVDTAGVRDATHATEREGIFQSEIFLEASHAWILVLDGSRGLSPEDSQLLEKFHSRPHLIVWNKRDLVPPDGSVPGALAVSAKTGEGLVELWSAVVGMSSQVPLPHEGPLPTATAAARLEIVKGELESLKGQLRQNVPPEFVSERTRHIIGQLESVLGPVTPDEVLDRVFRDFCIGK